MDAGKRTINDFFTGNKMLEIPFFQRAYVWDKPQWERLLEDVEYVCKTREPYFMGSVILKQQPTSSACTVGNVRTVIDGQQRLTTLSILIKVLCLKNEEMKRFDKRFRLEDDSMVLQHNKNDVEAYNEIMNLTSVESTERKDNISRAYQYFVDNLDTDKLDFDTICNKILFVGIDLSADEDEQQIFDTINSLGVRLTTAELLKNYLFGRNDIDIFNKYWLEVFERDDETKAYWDKEVTTGRLKRSFADLFFFSLLQIKMQDKALGVSAEDKVSFSKVDRLFDSYKAFVKKYLHDDKQLLLDDIKDYAEVFRKAFSVDIVDNELPEAAGLERLNAIIFALDTTTLIPYLLFVEHSVSDNEIKSQIYDYLESYIMRRLVTRQTTKNYNQLFTDRLILNEILTKQDLEKWISTQDEKINRMPDDAEVGEAFHHSCLTNRYATGVLYLIESKIRNHGKQSTQLLGISKYSLEHMMPKKWRNHWAFNGTDAEAEARDRTLLTLGNLTIITQALNASIRDSDWATKKVGKGDKGGLRKYAVGIETLSAYLDLDYWDENSIKARADDLAAKALDIWKK